MNSQMILDLETYAHDDAAQYIEEPDAPANYKDPAKIAAYIAEKKADALSRCALDVDLCRIVAIGMSVSGTPDVVLCRDEAEEAAALVNLWDTYRRYDIGFVGFNILGFDLPVLIRRSQYLGIGVPQLNLDRYKTPHIDLMERLSFNGKLRARSLSFYCRRFQIDVPDATSGKDIAALVAAGDWQGVHDHCYCDVQKTRRLAERIGLTLSAQRAVA